MACGHAIYTVPAGKTVSMMGDTQNRGESPRLEPVGWEDHRAQLVSASISLLPSPLLVPVYAGLSCLQN